MTALTDLPALAGSASDPLDQAAAMLTLFESRPAVCLRGLDHRDAGKLLAAHYPMLRYRRTVRPDCHEHLVVDLTTRDAVRIEVRYDPAGQRAVAAVAQTDTGVLFSRIAWYLTWWDCNGRPSPEEISAGQAAAITARAL